MTDNPESAEFWNLRYREGRMAWDYGSSPPDLQAYLKANPGNGKRVLIPGCGSAYELDAFMTAGYDVHAIELSPDAIARAEQIIGKTVSKRIHLGDFFTFPIPEHHFDIVYERTFHCALPPRRHPDYLKRMHQTLRPNGLLLGLFLYGHESEPPPYPMHPDSLNVAFHPHFTCLESHPSQAPIPMHEGLEHWQIWNHSTQ